MIDLTKPVQTRCGYPTRVICTDRNADFSVVALVIRMDTTPPVEGVYFYDADGKYCIQNDDGPSDFDLVNVPVTRYGYLPLPDKANTDTYVDIYHNLASGLPYIEITFEDDKPVDVRILPKEIT